MTSQQYVQLSAIIHSSTLSRKMVGRTLVSHTSLSEVLADILPNRNELPNSYYYANKLMCPFGLEYERIHACHNDCVFYRNEYEHLHECLGYGLSMYKREGVGGSEGPSAKVLWYLPTIP